MTNQRPGWKTSEFWLSLVTTVGGITTSALAGTKWGLVASALASGIYAAARTLAKR